jgi:SAM-dependent methyltransferase
MPSHGKPAKAQLDGHPDRERWNVRYSAGFTPSFLPHPLAERALAMTLPPGPVADLACGPSGSALLAAEAGREVTAVDVSDVALNLLRGEARRRGLSHLITLVQADLGDWRPDPGGYALVLCTGYWDQALFRAATRAVRTGGLLGWESLTTAARRGRPGLCAGWCVRPGEPACLLPAGYQVLADEDIPGPRPKRRLLARRVASGASGLPAAGPGQAPAWQRDPWAGPGA